MKELVIDSFAGGGGASEGIRAALGRDPDIAVNHDPMALAMHRINHPGTRHMVEDVVSVDAVAMCAGRPIGLLWMSPDCTDHSKAKGKAPDRTGKSTRGLAWAIVGWIKQLPPWQRPRVIILENVEEFEDWGPLLETGRRCPARKGLIFRQFVAALRALGAKRVEWRRRRAWQSGAATIRRRLYLVARWDDAPIMWPEPTHGNPNLPADAARIAAGELKPWRTAADEIDWSRPCPSIFETSAEIRRKHGIRAVRPLRPKTLARIAKGVVRYVLNAPRPFIVESGLPGRAPNPPTCAAGAPVQPFIVPLTHAGDVRVHDSGEPLRTQTTAKRGEHALVMPFVSRVDQTSAYARNAVHSVEEPARTIHTAGSLAVIAPVLVPRYGERPGQDPRVRPVDEPMATIVPTGNEASLIAPVLVRTAHGDVDRNGKRRGQGEHTIEAPLPTVTGSNDAAVAAVHLMTMRNADKPHQAADRPAHTITAGGARPAVVAAFLAQHNYEEPGHDAREPLSTIVQKGSTQAIVAAHMLNLRGSDRRDASAEEPLRTDTSGGNHAATVYAFLAKYYGEGLPSQAVDEPLHTVTQKPRHGVVTVTIDGETYAIVDIGMRMLTARERFNCQGFRRDYEIERGRLEDGREVRFTGEQMGAMCGNSVCPTEAEALVRANYQPREVQRPKAEAQPLPLFLEAAE